MFGLTLPYMNSKSSNFCNLAYRYLYAKLKKIGDEDLAPRVLTADSISEVTQYDFDMDNLTITHKHAKPPKNDKYSLGIEGLVKIHESSRCDSRPNDSPTSQSINQPI